MQISGTIQLVELSNCQSIWMSLEDSYYEGRI